VQKNNPHDSFAETRGNVHVKWYVDGKDYFYAVSEALSSAKKEIFIEDWWLSPELYLRRPPAKNENFRLDRLLKSKAEEGVQVYVVVYKEVSQLLTLDSQHSKHALQSLHPNIKVQRHPDHDVDGTGTYLWAHHEKMVVVDRRIAFIGGLDLCFGRYDTHSHQLADNARISKHVEVWPGQDYSNPRILDFADVKHWMKPLIDRKEFARMPWHDVSIGFVGKPALDVARHFIERWNFIKKEKAENNPIYPVLIAKSDAQHAREHQKEYPTGFETYEYFGKTHSVHPERGTAKVQILRSSSKWSHGIETEHSIMTAYIQLIRSAKHFIYIENQFFCTATKDSNGFAVKNLLGKELVERIKIAHQKKEKFRVIVNMPLLPSFPAEIDTKDAATLRLVCHYQYLSISRGGESIFDELTEAGINPEDYIQFFALRTYDKIIPQAVEKAIGTIVNEEGTGGLTTGIEQAFPHGLVDEDDTHNYVTEELYIHTKVMIVDDRYVICGSANFNDRSQLGDHDSEIAALIEDTAIVKTRMAGRDWEARKFAYSLRNFLFKEHLGLLGDQIHHESTSGNCHPPPLPLDSRSFLVDEQLQDPVSDEFYKNIWLKTATTNTLAFRDVFHCYPDDTVTTWEQFEAFIPDRKAVKIGHVHNLDRSVEEVKATLAKVRGHLVLFPTQFLKNVELQGVGLIVDSFTPMKIFV